jgi:hypothetical protein
MIVNNPPILELVNSAKKPPRKITLNKDNSKSGGGGGSGSSKNKSFGSYSIKNGAFHQSKELRDGSIAEFPLCDFTCEIIEEITADDGVESNNFLRIVGKRADGLILPSIDVPIKNFYSNLGNWPNEHWGTLPFIHTGAAKKDNLRACIHLYSNLNNDVPRHTVFKYTGWKKINDKWHYLTGAGAITEEGLINGVAVELGSGHMGKYQLPVPLVGEDLKQAANDALLLLAVCPNKRSIGATLLAAVARAPLGEAACIDFAIWIHGLTGSKKSAISAIALAFYGDFNARSFPSNWSDTVNDAEAKSFQAKDGIFIIDDFKPSVSSIEAGKLHAMAERIVRNTGNQAGRGRRGSSMEVNAAYFNRSMMIITGEDLPKGQSLLGRLLVLELTSTDVNNATLTLLQHAAAASKFTGLMSAYIKWLAPRMEQLKKDLPKNIELLRNSALSEGFASSHPRASEIYANLVAGSSIFLGFLEDSGAIDSDQSHKLLLSIETDLIQAFSEQGEYQADQDEALRFLQLLKAVLSSGSGHIACRLNQGAPEVRPFAWGWRDAGINKIGDKDMNPMGDCLGWYCNASGTASPEVWLQQETVFKVVQQFARTQGETFLMSSGTLWRRLHEKGLISKTEIDSTRNKPRLTVKRVVAGNSKRVMIINADIIESDN